MARKSRKNQVTQVKLPESKTAKTFSTAIYVRLSVENSGKDDDGDSIENQTEICREYVNSKPYLDLYGIYSDNGEKGWRFDRPEFTRLMDDVKARKVNCIVVKDLSRFGRDYIETGNYLEKIFPFLGVRFISITDNFDSFTCDDAESALMVPLKNMVNDVYAKDISRKIITSFRQRQETGDILPGNTPYGYVKSETRQYRYEIDEKVAPYIRIIFKWKVEGVSYGQMAERLNEMGAVTPTMRKVELGRRRHRPNLSDKWNPSTFLRILTNPVYTGAIVYGKYPSALYQGVKWHKAPKEEWRILEGMHEPIISRELFAEVQDILESNSKARQDKIAENAAIWEGLTDRFKGKIVCGDCGWNMRYSRRKSESRKEAYAVYSCGGYANSRGQKCSIHSIPAVDVEDAVLAVIQEQIKYAADMEAVMERMKSGAAEKGRIERFNDRISRLMQDITKTNTRRQGLYENFISGMIDESEYQYAKREYDGRMEKLNRELDEAKAEKEQFETVFSKDNRWFNAVRSVDDSGSLTDEMIRELIEVVKIYDDSRIEVRLNYAEDKRELEILLMEMEGAYGNR